MLGNVYRSGRRRTLRGVAEVALGLALLFGAASSAEATSHAANVRRGRSAVVRRGPSAVVIATCHRPAAKLLAKAHAAGHKIA